MKEHLFDKRVVKRALQEGLVSKEDYQRMLDALPDLSHSLQSNTNDIDVDTGADLDVDDIEEDDDDVSSEDEQHDPAEPEQLASTQAVHTQQETHASSDAEADEANDDETPDDQAGNAWASEL